MFLPRYSTSPGSRPSGKPVRPNSMTIPTLARIGQFIEHDLDYDRIQQVALGAVHHPNSSFRGDGKEEETNTIGRWKRLFTPAQVRDIESSLGNLLVDTGYALETPAAQLRSSLAVRFMNFLLPLYLDSKLWLKSYTPLARIAEKTSMGLADSEIKVRCQDRG